MDAQERQARVMHRADAVWGMAAGLLVWALTLAAVAATRAAANRWWFPPIASEQGARVDQLFAVIFGVIAAVFVAVHVLLGWSLVRFRHRWEGQRAAHWHEHPRLELTWTLGTAAVLVALTVFGGSLWLQVHGAPPPDAMTVEVVAKQFGWRFHYPGPDGVLAAIDLAADSTGRPLGIRRTEPGAADDVVSNELHVVVGRPVRLLVRATDVIHSFFVPHLRFKQDAVPGRVTQIWFTPTNTGPYPIACAELCGVGHFVMASTLHVETPEAFDSWMASQVQALTLQALAIVPQAQGAH